MNLVEWLHCQQPDSDKKTSRPKTNQDYYDPPFGNISKRDREQKNGSDIGKVYSGGPGSGRHRSAENREMYKTVTDLGFKEEGRSASSGIGGVFVGRRGFRGSDYSRLTIFKTGDWVHYPREGQPVTGSGLDSLKTYLQKDKNPLAPKDVNI